MVRPVVEGAAWRRRRQMGPGVARALARGWHRARVATERRAWFWLDRQEGRRRAQRRKRQWRGGGEVRGEGGGRMRLEDEGSGESRRGQWRERRRRRRQLGRRERYARGGGDGVGYGGSGGRHGVGRECSGAIGGGEGGGEGHLGRHVIVLGCVCAGKSGALVVLGSLCGGKGCVLGSLCGGKGWLL